MRTASTLGLVVFAALLLPLAGRAQVLNEVMPNPGTGDWNGDGMIDVVADEYVEIVNLGVREVDLSFWTLSDLVQVRHTFASATILRPGGVLVVFGGGAPSPAIPGISVVASSGSLGLNNSDETLWLRDGDVVVDTASFGAATVGQSFNRDPDGMAGAAFALHDSIPFASGGGSPGRRVTQTAFAAPNGTLPFINEWLPTATTLANDWNGDGIASDTGDEFVEIVNPPNGAALDLDGWTLSDDASVYHGFAPGTLLLPGASLVVVAGAPDGIPGLAIDGATWGSLSGVGDDVYLRDEQGDVVSRVSYGTQEPDFSWNRDPDADPSTPFFAVHHELATNFARSSPGRRVDGTPFPTPEPDGAWIAVGAALGALRRRKRQEADPRVGRRWLEAAGPVSRVASRRRAARERSPKATVSS